MSMVLQTAVHRDISTATRLREYLRLVRELSMQRKPNDLLMAYRERAQFVVPFDHLVSLSRRALPDGAVRITRSSRWETPLNPWQSPRSLPVVESGILLDLINGGRPVKIDELEVAPDDPAFRYFEGMRSMLGVPVFHAGSPDYFVVILRAEPASFTLDDLATVLLTINLLGNATNQLVLAERLEQAYAALDHEFRTVGEIQRDLLPQKLPQIAGVTIATHYETSTRAGGDYYDFFELPNGEWGILIADVSGHGAPSAVVMARMHALLHGAHEGGMGRSSPAATLRGLNTRLIESMRSGSFVTAFYGIYSPATRTLRYSNTGHNPPRVLRNAASAAVELPGAAGMPLAIVDALEVGEGSVAFEPGDRLVLYTDGITETFSPAGDLFGVERLDASIARCRGSASCITESILQDVRSFAADQPPTDDRTLVVLAFD